MRTYKKRPHKKHTHKKRQTRKVFGGADRKTIVLQNQDLNINYITNEKMSSDIPSFSELKLSNLNSTIRRVIEDARERPMVCENYKYSTKYLYNKLKTYEDVLMFMYNENRFTKYLTEMVQSFSIQAEPTPATIHHNIQVSLHLLFSQYLFPEPKHKINNFNVAFTPNPPNTILRRVVWLYEINNNPAFFKIIKRSKSYRDNMDANQESFNQKTKYANDLLVEHLNRPYLKLESTNFLGSTRYSITHDTINKQYKSVITVLDKLKDNSTPVDYKPAIDSLTNFKLRVTANYTDTAMVEWITKTLELVGNAYTATQNSQSTQLTKSSFPDYLNIRKNDSKRNALKTSFPIYYELMEEIYNLTTTYFLDDIFINSILIGDVNEVSSHILKYNSQSGKSGYIVNIAVEFKTTQTCLDLDLQLGEALKRQQTLRPFKYKPKYFISEVSDKERAVL